LCNGRKRWLSNDSIVLEANPPMCTSKTLLSAKSTSLNKPKRQKIAYLDPSKGPFKEKNTVRYLKMIIIVS